MRICAKIVNGMEGGLENYLHGIETTWGRWPCSQEECWRDKETVVKLMYLLYYPKDNGETFLKA